MPTRGALAIQSKYVRAVDGEYRRPLRASTASPRTKPAFEEQFSAFADWACHGGEHRARTRIASAQHEGRARSETAGDYRGIPLNSIEDAGILTRTRIPLRRIGTRSWALARVGGGVLDSAPLDAARERFGVAPYAPIRYGAVVRVTATTVGRFTTGPPKFEVRAMRVPPSPGC